MGDGESVSELELANNVAVDTTQHFEIDPAALVSRHKAARNGGLPILGCFHSHPNGLTRPSETDALQAAGDGRFWLIIANGEITAWQATRNTGFEPVALVVEG